MTVAQNRASDIYPREVAIEDARETLEKTKKLALNLSSKLLKECNDKKIINEIYCKLVNKRNMMNDNEDTTLIDSVINEYHNRINNIEPEVVEEFNLRKYINTVEETIEEINEGLNNNSGYSRKRKPH